MGYFSDRAIGGTIGEHQEDQRLGRQDYGPMAQEIILRARVQAAGLDWDTEVATIREHDTANLCRECGVAPRTIGYVCDSCSRQRERQEETDRRARQREQEAAGVTAAIARAAERGIQIGSMVTRRAGGERGRVVALSMACSHGRREYVHRGRERLACQYRPRVEVGIVWELTAYERRYGCSRFKRFAAVLLLSSLVLAEG